MSDGCLAIDSPSLRALRCQEPLPLKLKSPRLRSLTAVWRAEHVDSCLPPLVESLESLDLNDVVSPHLSV